MRRYYLHTRNGIFYAALIDQETGLTLTAKSTGTKNRDEALLIVADWLKNGIPRGKQRKPRTLNQLNDMKGILRACRTVELTTEDALAIAGILKNRGLLEVGFSKTSTGQKALITFLKEFWDYENSPYIRDKLAHGHRITRRYCHEALLIIAKHWASYFGNKPLNAVNRQDLRDFSLALKEKKGLAAKSINNTLLQGTTALKWAYTEGFISSDPSAGLTRFSGKATRRDILTEAETEILFKIKWYDRRAYIGCLLACTSGLRSGEIRAIRQQDIGEVVLDVSHSWSDFDGLKTPKNGESRRVPVLPEVRGLLLELLKENPHSKKSDTDINPFVFYSEKEDRPCSGDLFRRGLELAIKAAGINISGRKIDVHSFRHYYASRMADKVTADKVARITGHKSRSMAEHYQSHVAEGVIAELGVEAGEVFSNILQFTKKRA